MLLGQFRQHALGSRRLSFGGLGEYGQFEPFKQDLLNLLGRRDIERRPGLLVSHCLQLCSALGQLGTLHCQHIAVYPHAGALDL